MSKFEKVVFWCKDSIGVLDSFPVELGKDESNAESWAMEKSFNRDTHKYDVVSEGKRFEYDNKFNNVTIQSLSYRGNGGRAYKVVINHDDKEFLVDFREDGIMDVIRNTGIEPGGRLNGEFTFIKQGSQTKLVRIGSELHNEFIGQRERMSTRKISMKELKPMHVYKTRQDDYYLYVCDVYVPKTSYDKYRTNFRYKWTNKDAVVNVDGFKKAKLFIRTSPFNRSIEESFKSVIEGESVYNYMILTTATLIQDCDIKIDIDVDIVKDFRETSIKRFKKYYIDKECETIYSDHLNKYILEMCIDIDKEKTKANYELIKKFVAPTGVKIID